MNVVKIAWRSIQHRGLGSLLTIVSMALGVMLVVAVLTIHGVVSESFRTNSSFGYNVLMGSRGGSMQLTLSTVRYMGKPLEPIPFEYYLAFRDADSRSRYLEHSVANRALGAELATLELHQQLLSGLGGGGLTESLTTVAIADGLNRVSRDQIGFGKPGFRADFAAMAIPVNLGDAWARELNSGLPAYPTVATTSEFFSELVLDVETGKKFKFASGRPFHDYDEEHGFFECVIGSQLAQRESMKLGEKISPVHGDPNTQSAHFHDEAAFTVVGILEPTGTPNDKAIFCNIEGFYLMDDHAKPIDEGQPVAPPSDETEEGTDEENQEGEEADEFDARREILPRPTADATRWTPVAYRPNSSAQDVTPPADRPFPFPAQLNREPLPLEQREITSILIRTNPEGDEFGALPMVIIGSVNNGGYMEPSLNWSNFRPIRAQVAPQAVNPVEEVTALFANFIDPVLWLLLGLTTVICLVSGISILVGIYNSMNQRRHEIAVMRALGASRSRVTTIMLWESILLSLGGGLLGWVAGHALNAALSPLVEAQTGVQIGFLRFAPRLPLLEYLIPGISNWGASFVQYLEISPEFLLIPGLILLAIVVGVYPAITAYRTDVAKSLGS